MFAAVECLRRGRGGNMTAHKGQEIVPVPLAEVAGKNSLVTPEICETVSRYFRTTPAS